MASEVDICNSALAELGDTATVAGLYPPSGSIQAVHCARFYPISRDLCLEMHNWNFATKRVSPALLSETNQPNAWTYSYQLPSDVLRILAVLDPNATDDFSEGLQNYGNITGATNYDIGLYTPQTYEVEVDASGNSVLYTNQQNAVLRYTARVTDTTKFTPTFIETVTKHLASKLAGPVIKGSEGRAVSEQKLKEFEQMFGVAAAGDANQRIIKPAPSTTWIVNR